MLVIEKTVEEWICFFNEYTLLKRRIGYLGVERFFLDFLILKNTGVVKENIYGELAFLLRKHCITDIDVALAFLKKIKTYHGFESTIKEFSLLEEQYGIKDVAFILDEDCIRPKVDVYFGFHRCKLAFFPKDIYPWIQFDFEKGITNLCLYSLPQYQFIIDEKKQEQHQRVFYTSTFAPIHQTFPSKQEMDHIQIEDLRMEWFDFLLYHLSFYFNSCEISFSYLLSSSYYRRALWGSVTRGILTDGDLFDIQGNMIERKDIPYTDIVVEHANVILESIMENGNVKTLNLQIHPEFYHKYKEYIRLNHDTQRMALLEYLESIQGSCLIRK